MDREAAAAWWLALELVAIRVQMMPVSPGGAVECLSQPLPG